MFTGRYDHAIDNKGRVSLPASFRELLQKSDQDRLFITNFINADRERCLRLYTPNDWERLLGRIKQKNSFDRNVQMFQTFYIGGAHEVPVDRQGRILIPPRLREFAHLIRDVSFNATSDYLELWDREALGRALRIAEEAFGDPNFLQNLDL